MMRHKARGRGYKKQFSRTAGGTKGVNVRAKPMRGGFRL